MTNSPSANAETLWRQARTALRARAWGEALELLAEIPRAAEPGRLAHRAADAQGEVERYLAATTSPLPADRTALLMEPLGGCPEALFTFQVRGTRYVGRKLVSSLWLDDRIDELFCSRVTSAMILGELLEERLTSDGILLFFKSASEATKNELFATLAADDTIALDFPWPPFAGGLSREAVASNWTMGEDDAERLDAGEVHLRRAAEARVRAVAPDAKSFADPACSTGAFLSAMKRAFPHARVFGMDLDASMVDIARTRIDEAVHGDGITLADHVTDVDVLFCRFLNARVLTTRRAFQVLPELARAVRSGGHLVVFGHTPVLLPKAYLEVLGLEVLSATAHDGDAVFQMIVARRGESVRRIAHPWFSPIG